MIFLKYHIEAIKITKGSNSMIRLGMNDKVNRKGKTMLSFKSLKNSISSNKFNSKPKHMNTKITFSIILEKLKTRYLFIILFMAKSFHQKIF